MCAKQKCQTDGDGNHKSKKTYGVAVDLYVRDQYNEGSYGNANTNTNVLDDEVSKKGPLQVP